MYIHVYIDVRMHTFAVQAVDMRHACQYADTLCLYAVFGVELLLHQQALQKEYPNSPWSLTFSYGRALQVSQLCCNVR
jgi:hypothetical protein